MCQVATSHTMCCLLGHARGQGWDPFIAPEHVRDAEGRDAENGQNDKCMTLTVAGPGQLLQHVGLLRLAKELRDPSWDSVTLCVYRAPRAISGSFDRDVDAAGVVGCAAVGVGDPEVLSPRRVGVDLGPAPGPLDDGATGALQFP